MIQVIRFSFPPICRPLHIFSFFRGCGLLMEDATTTYRRRPLYTFASSLITIAYILINRALETHGPVGFLADRIVKKGSRLTPSICKIQGYGLSILSYMDDKALAVENAIEARLPLSNYLFDGMDCLVYIAETFPEKFDCVVTVLIRWVNFWIATLTFWGSDDSNSSAREKEIRVDTSGFNSLENEADVMRNYRSSSEWRGEEEREIHSYGEAAAENGPSADDEENPKEVSFYEARSSNNLVGNQDDPIIQLFEFGWQTPKTGSFIIS